MNSEFKTKHAVVEFAALAAHDLLLIKGVAVNLFFFIVVTSDLEKSCTMYLLCIRLGRALLIFLNGMIAKCASACICS